MSLIITLLNISISLSYVWFIIIPRTPRSVPYIIIVLNIRRMNELHLLKAKTVLIVQYIIYTLFMHCKNKICCHFTDIFIT